jgi:hypothetical protein
VVLADNPLVVAAVVVPPLIALTLVQVVLAALVLFVFTLGEATK